jgi:hypothetical protein
MPRTLVGTRDGLLAVGAGGPVASQLTGRSVTAVTRDGPELWAIVERSEIWHAPEDDWGPVATLEGLEATCLAMTDALHVGSSEARLFRLADDVLEPVVGFDDAEGRSEWYTPWGGPPATRSLSEWSDDVYVNVHVGGILHTGDHGRTWHPTIDIDADVHQVATAQGVVLAACAGGLAMSDDRGTTWTFRSDGPGWFDDNIDTHCLDALNDGSFAAFGTSDGRLFGSEDAGSTWHELSSDLGAIQHVLVLPDWA